MTTTTAPRLSPRRGSSRLRPARRRRWRLVVVLLMPALLAGVGWLLLGSGLLSVHRVTVTGLERLGPDRARQLAAIRPGTPLLLLDRAAVADRLRTDPRVADVSVRRSWPSGVSIRVTERTPVAVTPGNDGRLVDGEGLAFAPRDDRAPVGLPTLEVGRVAPDDPTASAALVVLTGLPPGLRGRVQSVAAETPAAIRLRLTGGVEVIWGDASGMSRKARVVAVLLGEQPTPGRIDVSAPDVATTAPSPDPSQRAAPPEAASGSPGSPSARSPVRASPTSVP